MLVAIVDKDVTSRAFSESEQSRVGGGPAQHLHFGPYGAPKVWDSLGCESVDCDVKVFVVFRGTSSSAERMTNLVASHDAHDILLSHSGFAIAWAEYARKLRHFLASRDQSITVFVTGRLLEGALAKLHHLTAFFNPSAGDAHFRKEHRELGKLCWVVMPHGQKRTEQTFGQIQVQRHCLVPSERLVVVFRATGASQTEMQEVRTQVTVLTCGWGRCMAERILQETMERLQELMGIFSQQNSGEAQDQEAWKTFNIILREERGLRMLTESLGDIWERLQATIGQVDVDCVGPHTMKDIRKVAGCVGFKRDYPREYFELKKEDDKMHRFAELDEQLAMPKKGSMPVMDYPGMLSSRLHDPFRSMMEDHLKALCSMQKYICEFEAEGQFFYFVAEAGKLNRKKEDSCWRDHKHGRASLAIMTEAFTTWLMAMSDVTVLTLTEQIC